MRNREGDREPPANRITSVGKALQLISLFRERDQIRVSEAAVALGAARSTAHRVLAMLEYHGFVRQDPETRAYAPGPELLGVALSVTASLDVRGLARPTLERLAQEVEETVHLVALDGSSAIFLDSVETSRALRIGSRVGRVMPAHCTAAGKAILSGLTAGELSQLYPDGQLQAMTPLSIGSLDTLETELAGIRQRGYATNYGESEDQVAAVAVAIPGKLGTRRAAITVSAPIGRLTPRDVARIAEAARRAAAAL
jgi:DNA-binding IclR family transcriptional regulator